MMLADGSEFTCKEEIAGTCRIILQDAKQVSEQPNSQLRIIEKLHQDVILGFDWFQSVDSYVDWLNYSVTLKNSFFAAGVPIHHNVKVKLCSFKVFMQFLHTNKGADSWFTFFK